MDNHCRTNRFCRHFYHIMMRSKSECTKFKWGNHHYHKRMRRTTKTKTKSKTKSEIRNPRRTTNKSPFSLSDNEMMSFGLFSSSSSSSSSSLSPLAVPFTVERSNKFNLGLSADSIRTATVPVTYSSFPNPNPVAITAPSSHNWNSSPAVNLTAVAPNQHAFDASFATFSSAFSASSGHNRSSVSAVNVSAIGPNHRVIDASFSSGFDAPNAHNWSPVSAVNVSAIGTNQRVIDASFSSGFDAPNTQNWSSMNSSVKSGLEHVDPPGGHVFGVKSNAQSHKWSLGNDGSDSGAPMMPLDYVLLPSRNFVQDYGSSQVGYSQSLSGSMYSGQVDGSRGKEDSSSFGPVFGRPVQRENIVGPSIVGASLGTSSPATGHGLVSSGFSNEHTFTWNDYAPNYSFETRSVFYDSSTDHLSPLTTKSQDISSTSPFNKNNISVSPKPLKENESYPAVGFEYKSSFSTQVPDINSTEEVNSTEHVSEHLDHHNPGEDSPCWKGAPTRFSSSGSQEEESSQHPMKKLQSNSASGEEVLLHMDQSLHATVENVASVITSESLDVNTVVKALNNLSELLLRLYSKDECRLKEQDHKALVHVIANLNVCMSSKTQQVDPAQKCSLPQQIPLNELHEDRNNDQYGKNNEEQQSAYVRDESLPKDYSTVQKIKRVLDENLEFEEDLPSDPLLYKNLWLEAEAELCVSSYKARLHRAKREMDKAETLDSPEVAPDIKKIPSSNFTPTAPRMIHEAAGRKTLNTQAPNISLPVVDDIDDVDNSVMARFNILKRREESNPVNMAEKEPADVESSGNKSQSSGVAEEPRLKHLLDTDEAVAMHSHGYQKMQGPFVTEDVDHAVMARLNILKSRGELEPDDAQVSEEGVGTSIMQNHFGSLSAYNASSFGWEYVMK
ncbi:hypothetical protein Hdeb2414_s0010g00340041 [Helianthus debilis subsp. tardiflorus]